MCIRDRLLDDIQNAFANLVDVKAKPKVAYMVWKSPLMVAGGDTYINNMLEKAGFINAFKHLSRYPEVKEEEMRAAEIDYILLSSEPFPFKNKDIPLFKALSPSSTATLVDGTMFSWYGSRLKLAPTYFLNFRQELKI